MHQFKIQGFNVPFQLDPNTNGVVIMLCVTEDIPAKLLITEKAPIESFYVELNLRKGKLLKNTFTSQHIEALSKSIDWYIFLNLRKCYFLGGLNAGIETTFERFL